MKILISNKELLEICQFACDGSIKTVGFIVYVTAKIKQRLLDILIFLGLTVFTLIKSNISSALWNSLIKDYLICIFFKISVLFSTYFSHWQDTKMHMHFCVLKTFAQKFKSVPTSLPVDQSWGCCPHRLPIKASALRLILSIRLVGFMQPEAKRSISMYSE